VKKEWVVYTPSDLGELAGLDTRMIVTKGHRGFRSSRFEDLKASKLLSRFFNKRNVRKGNHSLIRIFILFRRAFKAQGGREAPFGQKFVFKNVYRDRSFRAQDVDMCFLGLNHARLRTESDIAVGG
jgi:hypothetical protein